MFSLESPHRGDSNEYTQYTMFRIKKKLNLYCPKSAAMGFSLGTQEQVRNNRGKRAISVRDTEVLLYILGSCGCRRTDFFEIFGTDHKTTYTAFRHKSVFDVYVYSSKLFQGSSCIVLLFRC